MAATYALPSSTMNGHGHGGHHSHSHIRKTATQRSPLRPASMNEASYNVNRLSATNDLLKPNMLPHHQSSNSADFFYDIPQEQASPPAQSFKPRPSFSTPNGARTKSMERRKSVGLPTHLRLQPIAYGFPPPTSQRPRASTIEGGATKWMTTAEALSSLLIPLPYVLASLACSPSFAKSVQDSDAPMLDNVRSQAIFDWPFVCSLTSLTLVLVGLRGKFSIAFVDLDRRKKSLGGEEITEKRQWVQMSRRIGARLMTVGLPFYATFMLGAARVALVMLAGLASNIMSTEDEATTSNRTPDWRRLISQRGWTLGSIALQLIYDLSRASAHPSVTNICLGYLALGISILALPPPFPTLKSRMSIVAANPPASESATSAVLATPWETARQMAAMPPQIKTTSPLICTPEDVNLTLWTGTVLSILSVLAGRYLGSTEFNAPTTPVRVVFGLLAALTSALALTTAQPRSLQCNKSLGLVLGSLFALFVSMQWDNTPFSFTAFQSVFIGLSYAATRLDTLAASFTSSNSQHQHQNRHHHPAQTPAVQYGEMSRLSAFLIQRIPRRPWGVLLIGILSEKDSRRIFYFMCLNLTFMMFQTFIGVVTGSLGLLSDSIHMFFDCVALMVGMCAAVMSKWPPSTRFPYGYGKMDSLSGFANGIFLMLISVEIIYEAIERLGEGHEVKELGELFITSVGGLLVNIVGLTAFGHAHHGHSHGEHGGHDHSDEQHAGHRHDGDHSTHDENHSLHDHSHHDHSHHDHSHHDHSHHDHSHHEHDHDHPQHHDHSHDHSPQRHDHLPQSAHSHSHLHDQLLTAPTPSPSIYSSVPATPSQPVHTHPHSHSHGHGSHGHSHSHGSDNMMGIYLHIAADALGSASVIASTVGIWWSGWSGWDALASSVTAVLIFISAVPLVKTSARNLLLTVPAGTEYDLREALTGLSGLRGVANYAVPKFWLESGEGSEVLGVIHVIAGKGADLEDVKERAVAFLRGRHMNVVVQVEREGNGRCWCQAAK